MKKFFGQDKILVGIVEGAGCIVAGALVIALVLLAMGYPIDYNIRWYGGVFVPLAFLLHYNARKKQLNVTRTLIVILFVTFIAFMLFIPLR